MSAEVCQTFTAGVECVIETEALNASAGAFCLLAVNRNYKSRLAVFFNES